MSDTWDDEDRAIARALDAAPETETRGADEHLVDDYHEVLAEMPVPEMPVPDALEERVMAAALARRPETTPTLDRTRSRRVDRVRVAALAVAAVAAVVVIALIVQSGSTGVPAPTGHVALATLHRADVDVLLRAPGTRTGTFDGVGGKVALGRRGGGAVYELPSNEPLSIGLVSDGGRTIIGPATPVGGVIAFVVDQPDRVTNVELVRGGAVIGRAELTAS